MHTTGIFFLSARAHTHSRARARAGDLTTSPLCGLLWPRSCELTCSNTKRNLTFHSPSLHKPLRLHTFCTNFPRFLNTTRGCGEWGGVSLPVVPLGVPWNPLQTNTHLQHSAIFCNQKIKLFIFHLHRIKMEIIRIKNVPTGKVTPSPPPPLTVMSTRSSRTLTRCNWRD